MSGDHLNFAWPSEKLRSTARGISLAPVQQREILDLGACARSDLAGFSQHDLPMGLQILAPRHGDFTCLQFAYAYEQVTQWSSIRPSEAIVTTEEQTNGCACA